MFKFREAIKNNQNERNYLYTKDEITLYNTNSNNLVPIEDDSELYGKLKELESEIRYKNLRIYRKNMSSQRGNKMIVVGFPVILGTLTISLLVGAFKTSKVTLPEAYVYHNMEFDEDSIYQEEEIIYANERGNRLYVDDRIKNGLEQEDPYVQIYYGEGTDALQFELIANEDGTYQYKSHTNNLYNKPEGSQAIIRNTDEEYKKFIQDASDMIIRQANLTEYEKKYIQDLVANNENDILVKIKSYVKSPNMEAEIYGDTEIFFLIILILLDALIGFYLKSSKNELLYVKKLANDNGKLVEKSSYVHLFEAVKEYRRLFLEAEKDRILNISNIVETYNANKELLTPYEKKLVQEERKRIQ